MCDNQLIPIRDLASGNMQALHMSRNLIDHVIQCDPVRSGSHQPGRTAQVQGGR